MQVSNTLLPSGSMLSPVKDVCDMLTTMSINLVRGGSALQDLMEEVRPGSTGRRHDAATRSVLVHRSETSLRVGSA